MSSVMCLHFRASHRAPFARLRVCQSNSRLNRIESKAYIGTSALNRWPNVGDGSRSAVVSILPRERALWTRRQRARRHRRRAAAVCRRQGPQRNAHYWWRCSSRVGLSSWSRTSSIALLSHLSR